jgi:hypothetical protein
MNYRTPKEILSKGPEEASRSFDEIIEGVNEQTDSDWYSEVDEDYEPIQFLNILATQDYKVSSQNRELDILFGAQKVFNPIIHLWDTTESESSEKFRNLAKDIDAYIESQGGYNTTSKLAGKIVPGKDSKSWKI